MTIFSIIIPVAPGRFVAACEHLKKILPDDRRYEIILAEGCAPSRQRNLAAQEACGEVLYFLDDDSLVDAANFDRCCAALVDPTVAAVGGPSLTPAGDSWLQQLFGAALASPFGSGPVRNRYRAYGAIRATTDKELILCNLAVRRSVFMELGGFDERLYPNEENEFLERVFAAGYTLLHNPQMFVERSQRPTLSAFVRQMFNYGRGRGQQSLISGSFPLTGFIPLFFDIYLVFALVFIKYLLLLLPAVVYVYCAFAGSLFVAWRMRKWSALLLAGLYPLMHVVNGAGLFWGLIHGKPEPLRDDSIRVSRIKGLGEKF